MTRVGRYVMTAKRAFEIITQSSSEIKELDIEERINKFYFHCHSYFHKK